MRISRTLCATLAAAAMVAIFSQVALAQPDQGRGGRGGRGGFGGLTSVRLASIEAVQTALTLSDEQKEKITKLNDELRNSFREAFQGGGGREKMQELMEKTSASLNEVLDEGQQKRLMGIMIQVNGAGAVSDPAVAKELNITDEQKTKLAEVRESNLQAMREALGGPRDQERTDAAREEMRAKLDKLREEANAKLMAVLTSEQQAQLETLKGEKVEIDMAQLRGGPGGRGFGDRRPGGPGGRGRGDRNRDAPNRESQSQ